MGSSASKAARKFPKRAEPPAWSGRRTPGPSDPPPPTGVNREQIRDKMASEHRTEAIEKDARDPDFLANLQRLGPVKVDHHLQPSTRPQAAATNTTQFFKARQEQGQDLEQAAYSPRSTVQDKFLTSTLVMALNTRKGAKVPNGVMDGHEINRETLESVARFVNTPSVAKGGMKTFVDKDGNESVIAKAIWIDAPSTTART